MADEDDVFDVIVIGAGPVGETAAARTVRNGLTAAVVERRLAGGEKAVVDEDRRVLLGLTLVGPAVVDHLHAATIAVTAQVPLEQLWHAVPAFPTASEFWLELLEAYGL
jgi:pyruvate/2-oxoglutarate dehydrogenase complex dihydrolipoamide dehydrogenase (E3) component